VHSFRKLLNKQLPFGRLSTAACMMHATVACCRTVPCYSLVVPVVVCVSWIVWIQAAAAAATVASQLVFGFVLGLVALGHFEFACSV